MKLSSKIAVKYIIVLAIAAASLFLQSCSNSGDFDKATHYSDIGFQKGQRPTVENQAINVVAPSQQGIGSGYPMPSQRNNMGQNNQQMISQYPQQVRNNTNPYYHLQQQPQQYYYYQSPGGYQPYYAPTPYQQQPPAGYYVQPYAPQAYIVPNSLSYSNPYDIPPSAGQYQKYDADQYYSAPSQYNTGIEPNSDITYQQFESN